MPRTFIYKFTLSTDTAAAIHTDPFTCCVLPHFIQDEAFLDGLKDELLALNFHEKSNDLYKFQQVRNHSTWTGILGILNLHN